MRNNAKNWLLVLLPVLIFQLSIAATGFLISSLGIIDVSNAKDLSMIFIALLLLIISRRSGSDISEIKHDKVMLMTGGLIILAVILCLASDHQYHDGYNTLTIICAFIAAPIAEEIVFRGYFISRSTEYIKESYAALLSALLFAAVHSGIYNMAFAFIAGLILSTVFIYTSNTIYPIIMHSIININCYIYSIETADSLRIAIIIISLSAMCLLIHSVTLKRRKGLL